MTTEKCCSLNLSWKSAGLFLLLFAGWSIDSTCLLVKHFHGNAGIMILAGALCIAAVLLGLRWLQSRHRPPIHWAWLVAFWMVLLGLYLVFYPMTHSYVFGGISDREDALRVPALQMLHLHFPYYLTTFLGQPPTPMPGAVLLATPFLLLGRVSLQNLVWLAAFILFCVKFFRSRSTALAFLVVIALVNAHFFNDFVSGGDYVINTLYICVLTFYFLRTYEKNASGWQHILGGILLGLALSSRVVYVVIPPLLLTYLLQHGKGTMMSLRSFALPVLTAVAVSVPFYFYDPSHFAPLHVTANLNALPPEWRGPMMFLLPLLALLIACIGFFMRLTLPRFFLLAGIASATILVSPGLILGIQSHFSVISLELISNGDTSTIFVGLWAFSRFEAECLSEYAAGAFSVQSWFIR